jgi:tetratricopeptide (TPR) repeat protein
MTDTGETSDGVGSEPFDPQPAHRVFSVDAFNSAWDLIEKADRSEADIEEMIALAQASGWHWSQRQDVRPKNLSISAWQLARVYTEAGRYDEAEGYANRSLEISKSADVSPVYTGYAYESLARLARETDQLELRDEWLALARAEAERVEDALDRDQLIRDLDEIA